MRAVTSAPRLLVCLIGMLAVAVGLAAIGAEPASAAGGSGWSGGCNPYVAGNLVPVPCSAAWNGGGTGAGGSGAGGSGAGGGATLSNMCASTVLGATQAMSLGLSWPPPPGENWALRQCLVGLTWAPLAVVVISVIGAQAVTPQQLLVSAIGELHVPSLQPVTAPPRGHDGLVGLPEWFWISAGNWRARTLTVATGPVWATVTAAPVGLTLRPGGGLSPVTCAGPGTAYNPQESSNAQHSQCSYTYLSPSTGQPGDAYRASVTVTWRVTWTGSGGAGGVLAAALPISVSVNIPVAQGEALVTNSLAPPTRRESVPRTSPSLISRSVEQVVAAAMAWRPADYAGCRGATGQR